MWEVAGEGLPGIWEAGEGGVDRLAVALRARLLLLLLLPQASRRHNGNPGKCQKHSAWQHLSFISGQHSGFGGGQVGHHFCQNFLFDLLTFVTLCSSQKDDECVKKVIWCKDGAQCVLLSVLVALTLLCSFLARLPRCAAVAASKCKQRRDSLLLHSVHTLYHFHFEPFTWLLARHNLPSLVFLVWFFSNSELSRPLQIEMRQPSSPITPIARHLWGWLNDQLCFLSLFWLFSSRPTQPNWTCTGEVYLQKESHRSTTG